MTDGYFYERKIQMNKKINIVTAITIALAFLILFNMSSFAYNCNDIRTDTIRLHIIASSDSEMDQKIKYTVRDEILKKYPSMFTVNTTRNEAEKILKEELSTIESFVNDILIRNNITYSAEAELKEEYFETRKYDNGIKLPAGKYMSLIINLGNAQGKNWWCVIFPSLCLPAAQNTEKIIESVYTADEKYILESSDKYEIRFRLIEYIELLKNKVDNR